MAVSNVRSKPPAERYRRLPTGPHGLDPEVVRNDQRRRLQSALIELIEHRGYRAVRIVDLARLARVSQTTFYTLYRDKEALLIATYDRIAARVASTVTSSYGRPGPGGERLNRALRAFAELAAAEPSATSFFLLGAFGAGPRVLEHRQRRMERLEGYIRASRDGTASKPTADLTVKFVVGGVREVAAARLREGHADRLPGLAGELAGWAGSYPSRPPAALTPVSRPRGDAAREMPYAASERARRARGPLPSGPSATPRKLIAKSQRERIVDATASIVAEKGLASLTIPEIAKRANVSHQTFYELYPSKHDAYLGTQKVGMHQALHVTIEAYEAYEDDWPRAVAAGLEALVGYLASEPAHAHLSVVDTFAASPEALEIRQRALRAFAAYLRRGHEFAPGAPPVAAEAIAGGIWQVLHHRIADDRTAELPDVAPQIVYLALTPFVGPEKATEIALVERTAS
jgi:AcrR family transcriptional regulator